MGAKKELVVQRLLQSISENRKEHGVHFIHDTLTCLYLLERESENVE
ncbi:hypothetical protein J2T56_002702 [Natronobacillus azotifigens]